MTLSPDKETTAYGPVSPKHYQQHPSGLECIDLTHSLRFCVGSAIKYLWRAGLKGPIRTDLQKARQYVEWALLDEWPRVPNGTAAMQWLNWFNSQYLTPLAATYRDAAIRFLLLGQPSQALATIDAWIVMLDIEAVSP